MVCNNKTEALCAEAKAIGRRAAYQRVRRYALELLRANKSDIVTALVMRNLLAAVDGFDKEADAEFMAASEEFARIDRAEDLLRTAPIMDANAAKEAVSQ